MCEKDLKEGDIIEVICETTSSSYFPATVLPSPFKSKEHRYVQYRTLMGSGSKPVKEIVDLKNLRPVPPLELDRSFFLCENVDAFYHNAWTKGTIVRVKRCSKYVVSLDGVQNEVEFHASNLRLHRDWTHGSWVPPLPQQQEKSHKLEGSSRKLKLRIKCNDRTSDVKFQNGTMVEVKSDEEGYQGSWYTAVIVGSTGNDKFLVEYQTLKMDNGTELLQEEVHVSYIRPLPPDSPRVEQFDPLEEVDAWYNDGWWVGQVSEVLDDLKYIVYFKTTDEDMKFDHSKLRPHQEWIDDKWVASSETAQHFKPKDLKLKIKYSRTSDPRFRNGTMVEVKSNEDGYHGSWYVAVIIGSIGNDTFLVEYETLKTDDESEPLKEKADASYVRPCPPELERVNRFRMLEEVDTWYNDGWWEGLISKVLDNFKYAVYFWTTNEELEFEHSKLRPHQEWADGKWDVSFRKMSKSPVKSRPGKLKRQLGGITSLANFSNETKVEVGRYVDGNSQGSFYPAIIVGRTGNEKYMVEYQTLITDFGNERLIEEADAQSIRPRPPVVQRVDHFKPLEDVDAWYNYGWCVGRVCKVLESSKYTVYIGTTNEALEFQHSNLRPHQDFVDGQWFGSTRSDKASHIGEPKAKK